MKELELMKTEIEDVKKENHSLAYNMIKDLRRIIYCLIFLLFVTNVLWLWAVTTFDFSYDEIEQEQESTQNSTMIGEIH